MISVLSFWWGWLLVVLVFGFSLGALMMILCFRFAGAVVWFAV